VLGSGGRLEGPRAPIDAGASGTAARFLTAVAALAPGPVTVDGTDRMRQRPIGHLADALVSMGATVATTEGCPPVTVSSPVSRGGVVEVDMSVSSQFASAVLMIAPMVGQPVTVRLSGDRRMSVPYLTSTVEVMRVFGADVEDGEAAYRVEPTGYRRSHYAIEADASAAAYPLVAAAVTGGSVAILGIPADSSQPDLALLPVLEAMGCEVERRSGRVVLRGPSHALRAVDVDMSGAPDAALALAVAAVFADGPSRIRGLSTLRHKETDRLAALETELSRIGSVATVEGSELSIRPGPVRPARVETYDDHRMAMAFALAGLVAPGIEIVDPGCVSKTWPRYFDVLEAL
jgi:3-phosphoshikimate 1-carboxyvinyltransferase